MASSSSSLSARPPDNLHSFTGWHQRCSAAIHTRRPPCSKIAHQSKARWTSNPGFVSFVTSINWTGWPLWEQSVAQAVPPVPSTRLPKKKCPLSFCTQNTQRSALPRVRLILLGHQRPQLPAYFSSKGLLLRSSDRPAPAGRHQAPAKMKHAKANPGHGCAASPAVMIHALSIC